MKIIGIPVFTDRDMANFLLSLHHGKIVIFMSSDGAAILLGSYEPNVQEAAEKVLPLLNMEWTEPRIHEAFGRLFWVVDLDCDALERIIEAAAKSLREGE